MQILITLQFKIYFFLLKHDKSQSKLSHVSSNVKSTLQYLHSLRILILTVPFNSLIAEVPMSLSGTGKWYSATGGRNRKKKKTTTTKKKSEINFSGKRR